MWVGSNIIHVRLTWFKQAKIIATFGKLLVQDHYGLRYIMFSLLIFFVKIHPSMYIYIYIKLCVCMYIDLKLFAAAYSMFLHPSIQWVPDPLWTESFQRKRLASNSLMQDIPWPFQNKNLKYKKNLGLHHITVRGKRLKVYSLTMKRYNLLSIWNVSKQLSYIYQKSLISSKKYSRLCLCFVVLFQLQLVHSFSV